MNILKNVFLFIVMPAFVTALAAYSFLISQELTLVRLELSAKHAELNSENILLASNVDENLLKMKIISEQVSLLEESISPADKRWAKIKKVRKAVQDTISRYGYKNTPDINGLTAYSTAAVDYSEQYDVPISLILAITKRESAFNPQAVSRAGAQGLMQLMPETAKECASDLNKTFFNSFKVKDNVQLGVWYVWKMLNLFNGDMSLAVRAYNAGPTYVKKVIAGELQEYPNETIKYHEAVLEYKMEYETLGF
jgi:soluble lytic murein transglycosylase-like protein